MLVEISLHEQSRICGRCHNEYIDLQKGSFDRSMQSIVTLMIQKTHPMRLHVDEEILYRQDPATNVA
jgi:hypothetical protein